MLCHFKGCNLQAARGPLIDYVMQRLSKAAAGGLPHGPRFMLACALKTALETPARSYNSDEQHGFRLQVRRLWGTADAPRLLHLVLHAPSERVANGACWLTLRFEGEGLGGEDTAPLDATGFDLRGLEAIGLNLAGARLRGANLAHASLRKCNLGGADLSDADLRAATFDGCNLAASFFSRAVLNGAVLSGCQLLGADFAQSSLAQARVRECWMSPSTRLPEGVAVPPNLRWAVDVLMGPGAVVVMPEEAPPFAKNTFADLIRARDVTVFGARVRQGIEGECDGLWPRDYWFKSLAGAPGASFRMQGAPRDRHQLRDGSELMHMHRFHSRFFPGIETRNLAVRMEATVPDLQTLHASLGEGAEETVLDIAQPGAIELARAHFVPGGNLIMLDEQKFKGGLCVVGNDSIAYGYSPRDWRSAPADRTEKIKASYPGVWLPHVKATLWMARKETKADLSRILGVRKAVFVPQVFFHSDMLGMYFGRDLFGLHSFKKTESFLHENKAAMTQELGEPVFEKLLLATAALSARYEGHIKAFSRRLGREGVKVIELSAMLVLGIRRGVPHGLYSLFPNGVSFDPCDGTALTFYTVDAPRVPSHAGNFKRACGEHGIDVCFVGNPDGSDPMPWVEKNRGALRCLTAFNLVGQLNHTDRA